MSLHQFPLTFLALLSAYSCGCIGTNVFNITQPNGDTVWNVSDPSNINDASSFGIVPQTEVKGYDTGDILDAWEQNGKVYTFSSAYISLASQSGLVAYTYYDNLGSFHKTANMWSLPQVAFVSLDVGTIWELPAYSTLAWFGSTGWYIIISIWYQGASDSDLICIDPFAFSEDFAILNVTEVSRVAADQPHGSTYSNNPLPTIFTQVTSNNPVATTSKSIPKTSISSGRTATAAHSEVSAQSPPATSSTQPSKTSCPTISTASSSSSSLSTGAKAGISIGVVLSVFSSLLLFWYFCIRNRKNQNAPEAPTAPTLARNESTTYRKTELEGDASGGAFNHPRKPELALKETRTDPTINEAGPGVTANQPRFYQGHESAEKELANPDQPVSRVRSPAAISAPQNEDDATKYPVINNLEYMRAQERQMAGEIGARESLQRLREEHLALIQRIREAEEQAQSASRQL